MIAALILALAAAPVAPMQATATDANRPSAKLVVYNEEFATSDGDGRARFDRFVASAPVGSDGNPKLEALDACGERCSYWSFATGAGRADWTVGESAPGEGESIRGSVVDVAGRHLVRMEKVSEIPGRSERILRRTEIVVPDDGSMNWSYVPAENASGERVMLLTVAWIARPDGLTK